ncbi:MAG: gliding motility-associated C-terminal domain-containing protein [Flavobacteriales bacterium]|nr:gliding motility-associated C-terminal domain-containing protein [Flavobacteriales bacterium]
MKIQNRSALKKGLGRAALALSITTIGTMAMAHGHDHAPGAAGKVQFVPNLGQWEAAVRFKASFQGSAMFLGADGITWSRYQSDASELVHDYIQWEPERQAGFSLRGHAWRMRFVGADPSALAHGEAARKEYHNYYLGNDPSKWATRVPVYEAVHYERLWPGIDMRWHSEGGQAKYDLLVEAGADPSSIAFRYEGLDRLAITEKGDLLLGTSVGELHELKPVAWYADDNSPLPCAFALDGSTVTFSFPQGIEKGRPIVIDPVLVGATFSGQTGASNYGHCSTFDNDGNIYGGAQNFGNTFPSTVGAFQTSPAGGAGTDIVVNKFNPDATQLLFATFIGGTGDDKPHSMIVNSAGGLCVLGSSLSGNYPVSATAYDATNNGASDIVITHLNSDGTALIGSTYLGGSDDDGRQNMTNNYGDTYRGEIVTDAAGNIYIASSTWSPEYPVTAGALQAAIGGTQDAVLTSLSADCSTLLASTYLGGALNDAGLGLRVEGSSVFLCGTTASADFPMSAGGYQSAYQGGSKDGFVVRLATDGSSMTAGTFFGTAQADAAYFIDLDNDGDVHIYGQSGGGIPISPSGTYGQPGSQIFLASLGPDLTSTIYTTTIGGTNMAPVAFLVDVCDRIYISGYNPSGTFETSPDALYGPGGSRFYLACYEADLTSMLFGTYYGGSHVDGGTSRFDKRGVIYQGVCSGGQSMPTTPGAYAPTNNVGWDLGVFKIDFEQSGVNVNMSATATTGCAPATITFTGNGNAPQVIWDFGNGNTVVGGNTQQFTYTTAGTYSVMLIGLDSTTCNVADTAFITVTISDPAQLEALFTGDPISSCTEYAVQLTNQSTGSNVVLWDLNGTPSNVPNPYVTVPGPGTYSYTITVIDQFCQISDSFSMSIEVPPASLTIDLPSPVYLCPEATVLLNAGAGYDGYQWSTGETAQVITVSEPGLYDIAVALGFCDASDQIQVLQVATPPGMADVQTCPGRDVNLAPAFTAQSILWSTGWQETTLSVTEAGQYSFVATDAYGCVFADTVEVVHLATSDGEAIIPNVFTPNGDKHNDEFVVAGLDVQQFSMEVYNRWGQKMFQSADPKRGWKGSVDNESDLPVPDGTYFYIVSYKDLCAKEPEVSKAGHVTLLR